MEPLKGSLSNFHLLPNRQGSEFVKWDLLLEGYKYNSKINYHDIFVSTKESVCYGWFYKKFLKVSKPILLTGNTGTGKTIIIKNLISDLKEET